MEALGRSLLRVFIFGLLGWSPVFSQITYFEQGFDGSGPFESGVPGSGQFDKIVKTNTSSFQFANSALEMTRSQNPDPKGTSGIVKAVRSSAFLPTPETLYIQLTLSVKDISTVTSNAVYFYVGENFNPNDNTIPGNLLMFARFSLNFTGAGVVVHDFQKNVNSAPIAPNTTFTLTWVLNNSAWGQVYKFPETAAVANYKVMPYRYDLWVNGMLLVDEATGYPLPGSGTPNPYSPSKLTNFEIRFRDGFGTLGVDYILIRDINGVLPVYLTDFAVSLVGSSVQIQWRGSQQPDIYQIQRSTDGKDFLTIGMLDSHGQGDEAYQYIDNGQDDVGGAYFYRVVALTAEGKLMEVSGTKTVFRHLKEQMPFVYSNPTEGRVIQIYDGEGGSDYRLFTKGGMIVSSTYGRGAAKEILLYPEFNISPGMYVLTFIYRGWPRSLRVAVY
ncbi:hypothetical protein [Dyadobacter tibetensis]|uniref:hypothetical protein n=1 Tax=Dyadobacter tibetensis TaxID=1211851 RepID=UPI000472FA6B|nr:hypothetical protein [Dyadobacter tibetensis]